MGNIFDSNVPYGCSMGLLEALEKYEKDQITWGNVLDEVGDLCRDVPSEPIIILVGIPLPMVAISL